MRTDLSQDYRRIEGDNFPDEFEIRIGDNVLRYEKVGWTVEGERRGLRYGENPGQQAALFRLVNGNLQLGEVETIQPGRYLASNAELLQTGKHPSKTNITDADNALNILRYFGDQNVVAVMKHNNPCGVAIGEGLEKAYERANLADRIAAFGGAIALNGPVDRSTAEAIVDNYSEVVVAPEFEEGVMDILGQKSNLRVMRIDNMKRLKEWAGETVLDFKSLMDGGLIVQTSYVPEVRTLDDVKELPLGYAAHDGEEYQIEREPTEQEYRDMLFGWLVEAGITSNSVIYVKNGVTVGIGTGEQDRVGVAEIARDKAHTKLMDRISFGREGIGYNELILSLDKLPPDSDEYRARLRAREQIEKETEEQNGGLEGAVMVSDAFFPFRDGVDVGLREGVTAVIQPGGSKRDHESIQACNEHDATMVFTEQRSFRH